MILTFDKIKQVKENAMLMLEQFLIKRLESNDNQQLKYVQTMSFWLLDYIRMQTYEANTQIKYKKYKRGDVIKVNFGYRIGREHGGLHYAIVIDTNNALASNLLTVIPLSSVKPTTNLQKLGKDRIFLDNEIYKCLISKMNSLLKESPEQKAVRKELLRMKSGTIALVGQITTISKYRIYDPLSTKNALHGIRISEEALNKIDAILINLFTH